MFLTARFHFGWSGILPSYRLRAVFLLYFLRPAHWKRNFVHTMVALSKQRKLCSAQETIIVYLMRVSPMNTKQKAATLINFVFYTVAAVIVYFIFKYAVSYLLPFILSFVLIYVLQKPMIYLSAKFHIHKKYLTIGVLILLVLLFLAIVAIVIYNLSEFLQRIMSDTDTFSSLYEMINRYDEWAVKLLYRLPKSLRVQLSFRSSDLIPVVTDWIQRFAGNLIKSIAKEAPRFLISMTVFFVSACFFAVDYDKFIKFIKRQLQENTVEFIKKVKAAVNSGVVGIVRGYFILFMFTFAEIFLGLLLLRARHAAAVALLIAVVDLLPVLGTGSVLIPWGIIMLIKGETVFGIGLIILYLGYSVARYFTEPKVISGKVGVHPLISLLSMFLGLRFFGFFGLIILPLSVAVLSVLQQNGLVKLWK